VTPLNIGLDQRVVKTHSDRLTFLIALTIENQPRHSCPLDNNLHGQRLGRLPISGLTIDRIDLLGGGAPFRHFVPIH
jgi:hypothetical protein